jgi:hypothetical protein
MAKKMKRKLAAAVSTPARVTIADCRNTLFPETYAELLLAQELPHMDAAEAAWLEETKGWR